MLMAILEHEITEEFSKKPQKTTENQRNTKTEVWSKWGPEFYI